MATANVSVTQLADHRSAHRIDVRSQESSQPALKASCGDCALFKLCMPIAVNGANLSKLDAIIEQKRPVSRGANIYRQDDQFEAIYVVRTGAIKTYSISEDGQEQITGFYMPGEVFGIDGLNTGRHSNWAKALEATSVCKIPFNQLEKLSAEIPSLQRYLFQIMSQEIQTEQQLMLLLSKRTAEERIAAFLMSLSSRFQKRRLAAYAFRLPMSRIDMGNYLGLAVETVSRILTRFQQQEILAVNGKEVEITNVEKMQEFANIAPCSMRSKAAANQ